MGISLNPKYLKRYKDIAALLWKYGKTDLISTAGLEEVALEEDKNQDIVAEIEHLPDDLEKLGPTYVKLGQFFSTRSDMLPQTYIDVLERLQDKVKPVPLEQIMKVIDEEIPMRFSKAFLEFDPEPIGAASIGQVHRAVTRDGRPVVVKVQRPDIKQQVLEDLEAIEQIAGFMQEHTELGKKFLIGSLITEFKKSVLRELDYRNEAQNLKLLAENLKYFQYVTVPLPVEDYSTSKVITMDYIRGTKVTTVSPLRKLEFDGARLAEALFKAYLKQILIDGFYHSDPHPGNVFITDDNKIALLDLGMVGYLSEEMQNDLLHILLAIGDGRGDEVAEYAIKLNTNTNINKIEFKSKINELVSQQKTTSLQNLQIGRIILEITKICGENGINIPHEFAMLGKTLLNLDKVGKTLNPNFNPNQSIRRNVDDLVKERMLKTASSKRYYNVFLESQEFIEKLPARVNNILDKVTNNEIEIKVKTIDEVYLMDGLQKIANRIAIGLILSAAIIGAAIIMRIETTFTILGYPGIAMILFCIAIVGSISLAYKILVYDESTKKKEKKMNNAL
jgi:predicted unusual protein kinase regulating ubiquinone biosynthesis (AarF/ABC1/UbiB family)